MTTSVQATVETKAEAISTPEKTVRFWIDAWDTATEQEKDWMKSADEAVKIYRSSDKNAYNILHANVQTKVPVLFNSSPVADVRQRGPYQRDEIARKAAQYIEFGLQYQLDDYDFDIIATTAVRHMEIAGRGVARVRWKPQIIKDENGEVVGWEEVQAELVPWRSFRRGPADVWSQVPWVGYELYLTKDEVTKLIKDEPNAEQIANDLQYDVVDASAPDTAKDDRKSHRELSVFKRVTVYEIWDKDTRKIYFIAPGYSKAPLKVADDPYGLLDFFDCAAPLQALFDPDTMTPICPYDIYKAQADELEIISQRIKALVKMIKFAGIRASELEDLGSLEDIDDGEFIPSSGAMALAGGRAGISDGIWTIPVQELITVVRELVAQREAIKQVIYEITGIADVLRGATDPNETLGAQQIKAQWGSLRINDEQRMVARWCRDILRIKAEIMSNKFSRSTFEKILNEQLAPEVEEMMRDDVRRRFMIDIESDSTIRSDVARAQENMASFMQSTAQFIQTFMPLMQPGPNGQPIFPPALAEAAVVVFGAFAKNYKLGKVVDDVLAKLEGAAAQMQQQGQKSPEEEQEEQEAKMLQRAGLRAEVRGRMAQAAKTEAEAQIVPDKAKLDAAQVISGVAKDRAQQKQDEIRTAAQILENQIVAQTGQPEGFVQ